MNYLLNQVGDTYMGRPRIIYRKPQITGYNEKDRAYFSANPTAKRYDRRAIPETEIPPIIRARVNGMLIRIFRIPKTTLLCKYLFEEWEDVPKRVEQLLTKQSLYELKHNSM